MHVAVGLTDALRMCHLLFETVRVFAEIRIRRCNVCKFSNGGQLLAAVDSNLITVTTVASMKRSHTLKGITGKVN